jgi:hypothetical protein
LLRGGFLAAFFLEEHVVGGAGVERWVEVDEVHAGVLDVIAEDSQIVAKIELVSSVHVAESITQAGRVGRDGFLVSRTWEAAGSGIFWKR